MVVQVGDKVLVYGAGTPWAFAKKIAPVEVGDKVDVVTLSDGTKLAMPKIELDLSEYVWVVPEFDTPFNIGDVPSRWGLMPLGAAVFTITGIPDCWTIEDDYRGWDISGTSLINYWVIIISGPFRGVIYVIQSFSATSYTVNFYDSGTPDYEEFTLTKEWFPVYTITKSTLDIRCGRSEKVILTAYNVLGKSSFSVPYRIRQRAGSSNNVWLEFYYSNTVLQLWITGSVYANSVLTDEELEFYELGALDLVNPKFPDYDVYAANCPVNISRLVITTQAYWNDLDYIHFEAGALTFTDSECPTLGLSPGEKYVIYDPVTKKLVFNDANKAILSAAYWRDIEIPGEEISTSSVTYAWDGVGTVYLSQLKYTSSTIFYDNELRVDATAAGATKTIPYHTSDPYVVGGETVSRELVNITSILRAGKNDIVLTVRSSAGTKIGFPTPVYIIRSLV